MKRLLASVLTLAAWTNATSATDRVHALATELRCPVCQNQTLADSNADLARDLKDKIREQVAQGRSDEEIRQFMVQRYGDFVLYQPPMRADTALLWAGPFALLALGGIALGWRLIRMRAGPALPDDGHAENRCTEEPR